MPTPKLIDLHITCHNQAQALAFDALSVAYVVCGIAGFSCRFNAYFTVQEIKSLATQLKNSRLAVLLNDLYSENQLPALTALLQELQTIPDLTIMFADYAILQICYENNWQFTFHYQPETLVTSYGQFPFYHANDVHKVHLATELTLLEVQKILQNKQQMYCTIKGFGLGFVMHSRWKMISNFLTYAQLEPKQFANLPYFLIKEKERALANVLYEDEYGTHMLTGYYICCLNQLQELQKNGLDGMFLDGLFVKEQSFLEIVKIYQTCLQNEIIDAPTLNSYYDQISQLCELPISPGFFGKHSDVLHTLKNEP